MYSAKILGKQMDSVYGLYLPEYVVPAPEAQTNFVEIIGRDGAIDKTAPDGVVRFKDREWELQFEKTGADVSANDVPALSKLLMNDIHGKRGEVIFDDDASYKWIGRVFVQNVSCKNNGLIIVSIQFISEPYKYGVNDIVVTDNIQTVENEYSGPLISFDFDDTKELLKLSASMLPIQDLNGYDYPWPEGGGVNLLDISTCTTPAASYGLTKTIDEDGYVHCDGINEATGSMQFAVVNVSEAQKAALAGQGYTISITDVSGGTILSSWGLRTENEGSIAISLQNPGLGETVHLSFRIVVAASAQSVWTPYSNICPITGLTGLTVYVGPDNDPDNATAYDFDWTSTAGTVYGGTLDVLSGLLTVGWANITSYNGETITEPWLSSMDAYESGATPTTGAQVVYTLATPLTYQLTAQEVTLLATNNIWADFGDVYAKISTMDKVKLTNGRKPIVPKIDVTSDSNVTIMFYIKGTKKVVTLSSGSWKVSDLILFEGDTYVYESGSGTIKYSYPEVSL